MKILYVTASLSLGGLERQLVELVRGIRKHKNVEPIVSYFIETKDSYKNILIDNDCSPVLIEKRNKFDLFLLLRFYQQFKNDDIDIIHSFGAVAGLVAVICGKLMGIPVVASSIRDGSANKPKIKFYNNKLQALLSHIFVSNSFAGLECFQTNNAKYRVVYNGIDLGRFKRNNNDIIETRKRYHLDRFDHVVTMIGNMGPRKDFDSLVEAIPMILETFENTGFLLVGGGPDKEALEEKIIRQSLSNNVIFTGYTHDIIDILANTTISVLMTNASNHAEGTSNSLLESMAMGAPLIASRGGGTNELIEDGFNGLLVNPFDHLALAQGIIRMLNDSDLRKKMGAKGKMILQEKFGYNRYIEEYYDIYQEVFEKKKN